MTPLKQIRTQWGKSALYCDNNLEENSHRMFLRGYHGKELIFARGAEWDSATFDTKLGCHPLCISTGFHTLTVSVRF